MVFNDDPHASTGTDLGLYSSQPGKYIRVVTNDGRFNVYNDAASSDGYGVVANLEVTPTNTTVRPNLTVPGTSTTSDLVVTGRFVGQPSTNAVSAETFTASSDGILTLSVEANGTGARGHGEIRVNGELAAVYSVHFNLPTDNHVQWGSTSAVIRRGDTVETNWTVTSGNINGFDFVRRFVPLGASL